MRGGKTHRRLVERQESRQRLDALQPGVHVSIGREIDVALGCACDVAVQRDVGDGGMAQRQELAAFQLGVDQLEDGVRARNHLLRVVACTKDGNQPCGGGAIGDFTGGDGQPALHGRGRQWRFRQPVGLPSFLAR